MLNILFKEPGSHAIPRNISNPPPTMQPFFLQRSYLLNAWILSLPQTGIFFDLVDPHWA